MITNTDTANRKKCLVCDKELLSNNTIGVCRKHRHRSAKRKEYDREFYYKNQEKILIKHKEYREKNAEKLRLKDRVRSKTIERKNQKRIWRRKRRKERMKNDILFKLTSNLRRRLHSAITSSGMVKTKTTKEFLGADIKIVKEHLEKQFTEGMNWGNYGKWHIDHIIPISSAKTQEKLEKLFHYTNLQPLWAEENLRKSDKILNENSR